MIKQPDITIIIPCFNESLRLKEKFSESYNFFKRNFASFEVILVNDGSPDKTKQVIKNLADDYKNIRVLSYNKNKGKGYAVKLGVAKASGKIICFMDADFAISLKEMPIFLDEIKKGADIVI